MQIPLVRDRLTLAHFDKAELQVIQQGVAMFAATILDDAVSGSIEQADLARAGGTYALAMRLSVEVDTSLGLEHPTLEELVLTAQVIAEGDAPLAAKYAAEAEGAE